MTASTFRYPVYVDGRKVESLRSVTPGLPPPTDLQAQHLWTQPFPSFESPGAANVKDVPYRAKGDGRADDTAAIQRAIDEREIVFLSHWEGSTDPRLWHFLIDRPTTGTEVKTVPLDRPVLYLRGSPVTLPGKP